MTTSPTSETAGENSINLSVQNLIPGKSQNLARVYVENPDTPALAVYLAAKKLLSPEMDAWETETVTLEFERAGLKVPEENLEKIFCISALESNWQPFTDAAAMKNMILAVTGGHPVHDTEEKVSPGEAAFFFALYRFHWPEREIWVDHEPRDYLALILHDDGFVVAPRGLGFCQPELTSKSKNPDLVQSVSAALLSPDKVEDLAPGMAPIVQAQREKLEAVSLELSHYFTPMVEAVAALVS